MNHPADHPIQGAVLPDETLDALRGFAEQGVIPSGVRLVGTVAEALYVGEPYRELLTHDHKPTFVASPDADLSKSPVTVLETSDGREDMLGRDGCGMFGPYGTPIASREELLYRALVDLCRHPADFTLPSGDEDTRIVDAKENTKRKALSLKRLALMVGAWGTEPLLAALCFAKDHATQECPLPKVTRIAWRIAEHMEYGGRPPETDDTLWLTQNEARLLRGVGSQAETVADLDIDFDWADSLRYEMWEIAPKGRTSQGPASATQHEWSPFGQDHTARTRNVWVDSIPEAASQAKIMGLSNYIVRVAHPRLEGAIAQARGARKKRRVRRVAGIGR